MKKIFLVTAIFLGFSSFSSATNFAFANSEQGKNINLSQGTLSHPRDLRGSDKDRFKEGEKINSRFFTEHKRPNLKRKIDELPEDKREEAIAEVQRHKEEMNRILGEDARRFKDEDFLVAE